MIPEKQPAALLIEFQSSVDPGMAETLILVLQDRFGQLAPTQVAQIRAADFETLQRLYRRCVTAASLSEVLSD